MRQHEALRAAYDEIVAENKDDMTAVLIKGIRGLCPLPPFSDSEDILGIVIPRHWMVVAIEEKGNMARLSIFAFTRRPEMSDAGKVEGESEVVSLPDDLLVWIVSWTTAYERKKPGIWNRGKGYRIKEILDVQMRSAEAIRSRGGFSTQTADRLKIFSKRLMELHRNVELRECWEVDREPGGNYN